MTDYSGSRPFKHFGTENERQGAGFYVLVGLATIVVLIVLFGEQAPQVMSYLDGRAPNAR